MIAKELAKIEICYVMVQSNEIKFVTFVMPARKSDVRLTINPTRKMLGICFFIYVVDATPIMLLSC